jgi:hypothetical protein
MLRALVRTMLVAVLLAVVSSLGCGGGSSPSGAAGSSGVTGTKTLAALSAAEKGQICDWTASLYGGYGKTVTCADSTIDGPESQADCLAVSAALSPSCSATVAQAEGCTKLMATCDAKVVTPDCLALYACYPSSLTP